MNEEKLIIGGIYFVGDPANGSRQLSPASRSRYGRRRITDDLAVAGAVVSFPLADRVALAASWPVSLSLSITFSLYFISSLTLSSSPFSSAPYYEHWRC